MKSLIIITLWLSTTSLGHGQTTDNQINELIVKEYLKAAFNRDFSNQASYMHPDIIDYHPTVLSSPSKGKDIVIQDWKNTLQSMDSVEYTRVGIGTLTFENGELAGEWLLEQGLVKSKFKDSTIWVSFQMTGMYKIENGLIVEVRNYGNVLDIYQQLGYTLSPPISE